MNRQQAAKLVAVITAACPGQSSRLDASRLEAMADAFASLLGDLTYEQCDAAVRVLLQTRPWMPAVAEIRSTALELVRGTKRVGGEAWGVVLRMIGAKGAYREPGVDFVFSDPIIAKCVHELGWRTLCLSENQVADRARFIELYDKLAAEEQRAAVSPQLAAAREVHRRLEPCGEAAVVDLVDAVAFKLRGGSP